MQKRLSTVLLVLCIALALIPGSALAADSIQLSIPDTAQRANVYALNGGDTPQPFTYDIPEYGAAVLIFYNTDCPNSQSLFCSMNYTDWVRRKNINVYAIESTGKTREEVQAFKSACMGENLRFVNMYCDSASPTGSAQVFHYLNLTDPSADSVTFPYVAVVTAEANGNQIRYAEGGIRDAGSVFNWLSILMGVGDPPDYPYIPDRFDPSGTSDSSETPEPSETSEPSDTSREKQSGGTGITKMSRQEITSLLSDNPTAVPGNVFDEQPSCASPCAAGKVSESALQTALNRLNALRRIAGLPDARLGTDLCENAQYGAVVMARLGTITHYPQNPGDVPSDFFSQAAEAARTSNLSAGRSLPEAVDGLMLDKSGSNLESLGHRRWQLNPSLGKVGFGYAENPESMYRRYMVEKVFDTSGSGCSYDFISWPASGNFPVGAFFTPDAPWSITLNPAQYQTPSQSAITVTLTKQDGGQTWTFSGSGYSTSDRGEYFHVNNDGYGVGNCIIFRPEGVSGYNGHYTVRVDGLKARDGSPVEDFVYSVDFFEPGSGSGTGSDSGSGSNSGHTHEYRTEVTAPTCTKKGYTTHICDQCGDRYQDSETAALGHNYGEWHVTTTAGASTAGQQERVCSRCGDRQTETIPATGSSGGSSGSGNTGKKPATPATPSKPSAPSTPTAPSGGARSFPDVPAGAWYESSVDYVVSKGLFGGVGNNSFAPGNNMTRAMMWTVLARHMGVETGGGSVWYQKAQEWAVSQGISDGARADGFVTREQFVTMLWRLSGEPGADSAAGFADSGRISSYARTAVDWAVGRGILNGYRDGTFRPQGTATRAEVAKMLTVFCTAEER